MNHYNPSETEPKWQKKWNELGVSKAKDFDETRQKYVMLTEFPYPSGDGLHMGHVREYTLGDIMARHKRMLGYNVLYPMGYDAFGLPTENFAIKNKIAPQVASDRNIGNFQKQFDALGVSVDWDRSIRTDDPKYYKWTQWLFLQFFKAGLAYQKEIALNWCPKCKTGLANEEVVNGKHERCDTPVEKKQLKQWLLKITEYADRLIDGLEHVDYPSRIADQQINWIGRSSGTEIDFEVADGGQKITVFTTRPDTLFGVTFMVLAPEHPLVETITIGEQKQSVTDYVKTTQSKTEIERMDTSREKTGVFTGAYTVNPVNGNKIPIWITDYVLTGYGTGAIMAVPAHDERDHEFAKKFKLPIVRVIQNDAQDDECTHAEGVMMNSGEYDGLASETMREKIVSDLVGKGIAAEKTNYRLRDWIFSRQHYWGEPIPIIHCEKHGAVAVPDSQLPVELPSVEHYEPTDTGESPLAAIGEWVNTTCPRCNEPAKRETDTMPNWAGSSWYYLRYFDAKNDQVFADRKKLDYWGEVDMYLGGMEHTTLHLLYSRFWHLFFYDQGLVPTPEPYKARRGQGIVLASDGTKMSKSKGNVINPIEVIEAGYGADALRVAVAFSAPYDQTTPWSTEGVAGMHRFLNRIWALVQEFLEAEKGDAEEKRLLQAAHRVTKKVSEDIHKMEFNTAAAALMEYVNELYKIKASAGFAAGTAWHEALTRLLQLVAPFAPHVADELWAQMNNEGSIHLSTWPKWDDALLVQDTVTIAVQVNGKVRVEIAMPVDADEVVVRTAALAEERVKNYVGDNEPKRVIYIPGRIINIVV